MAKTTTKATEDSPTPMTRKVKHAMFTYDVRVANTQDPEGDDILQEKMAYAGEVVPLLPHDIARGEKHGAFFEDHEPQQGEDPEDTVYLSNMTHTQVVNWLKRDTPEVSRIIKLVEEDPDPAEAAQLVLDAESEATSDDSREELTLVLKPVAEGSLDR